jgi:hypothetical protein
LVPWSPAKAVGVAIGLLLLTGCSGPELACTMIAAPSGVGVTVAKDIAAEVTSVRLTVCHNGDCQDHAVELSPGSISVDQGCSGTDPDSACSATAVPDGTKAGFADVPGLPAGPITISATLTRSNKRTPLKAVEVTSKTVYPNGPLCGGEGNQARVTISADGLH